MNKPLDNETLRKVLNNQQYQAINKQHDKGAYRMVKKELETLQLANDCQSLTNPELAQTALAGLLFGLMAMVNLGMISGVSSVTGGLAVVLTMTVAGIVVSDTVQDKLLRLLNKI
jgi:hypothetical protein